MYERLVESVSASSLIDVVLRKSDQILLFVNVKPKVMGDVPEQDFPIGHSGWNGEGSSSENRGAFS